MDFGASKVVVQEQGMGIRPIGGVSTSVAAAIGIAERGPIGVPTLVTSLEDFMKKFGDAGAHPDLIIGAYGFFQNGGTQLWVVRTAHYNDPYNANSCSAHRATAYVSASGISTPAAVTGQVPGPFRLRSGERLVVAINGMSDREISFEADLAYVRAMNPGPFALAHGQTLKLRMDDGPEQTIEFDADDFDDIAHATADELAALLNGDMVEGRAVVDDGFLAIASDTEGTASRIQVTGGTANQALGFPTGTVQGAGNVADISRVTVAEVQALCSMWNYDMRIESSDDGCLRLRTTYTGSSNRIQVRDTTAPGFGLDTEAHQGADSGSFSLMRLEAIDPGSYANRLEVQVYSRYSQSGSYFDIEVVDDGNHEEFFGGLSSDRESDRYFVRVINDSRDGSRFLRAIDQRPDPNQPPSEGQPPMPTNPMPSTQTVQITGGSDGVQNLNDGDFIGNESGRTGMYALDRTQDISLLFIPGRATSAVHNAMLDYCEQHRGGQMFAILDPPEGYDANEIVSYVQSTGLEGQSEYGAIYWPRVRMPNMDQHNWGPDATVVVPPSGFVAGVFARTDSGRPGGVYDPPAGIEKGKLFSIIGFETDECLDERKRDVVYPHRINPLTTGPGLPRYIDGSRTLKDDGNFPYIAERRGVIFIEKSLKNGLQFARHKNNDEGLRAMVRRTVFGFLLTQMNNGAFRSREPAKAFYVECSGTNNTPDLIFQGVLIADIGLATNKPAEFILLRVTQSTKDLEEQIAAAGG